MSDTVKLIIEIPIAEYELIVGDEACGLNPLTRAIAHGTPLPKGHGRLIDADAFIAALEDASKRHKYKELLIGDLLTVDDVFKAIIESLQNKGLAEGDAPTIIEADKTESEVKPND